ncbi:response regulator [Calidifontibacter terrae]
MPTPLRIGAIDDHPIVLRGLMAAIGAAGADFTVDFLVTSLRDLDWNRAAPPDVLLLDIDLNDGSEADENVATLVAMGLRVLLFTAERRPAQLRRLIAAGAAGLALKSDSEDLIIEAIRQVAAGEFATSSHLAAALLTEPELMATLAPREMEVLEQLAAGVPKKAIGGLLDPPVSASTVETYFQRIAARYAALGRPVANIYGSLREATRDGHLDL